ncbi:polymer-forming cytoskeletal protein [Halogeometricum sp. S1BR25-6]|uniref:Polymer-forming cytoskeletal protein n=1 Tax=Halogeometricum salsisoli TaxID=2950536 RepID=A0ABU2GCM1_9EURY|nr:polymer-forming cytoskeletal protein [Halogeometricum sp. S1BR25-6]MDS0298561.1 polymer-forming cytoskeletal protein [Halogeometricum sp. S1BR25-6]
MSSSSVSRLLAVVVALLVFTGSAVGVASAQAQQAPFGPAVTVAEGETYSGTLEAAAGTVVVAGTVDGDVQALAGNVVVTETGRVTGDVGVAAGSVTIDGTVDGDVRTASGTLLVGSTAVIGGNLEAGAGDVRLAGTVDGDVTVGADSFLVGSTAVVGGSVTYDAETFGVADGASVAGTVTRDENLVTTTPVVGDPDGFVLPESVVAAYWLLVNLVLGAVLLLVAPRFAARVTNVGTERTVRSGGVGLLALVGVPVALVLTLLTVVGIPLSIAGFVLFALVLWVTSVYGALVLGTWLLSLTEYESRWAALAVGLLLVALVGFVPFAGGVLQFLVLLVGLGAFALALRGEGGETGGDSAGAVGGDEAPVA